jgi:hypothetical protein
MAMDNPVDLVAVLLEIGKVMDLNLAVVQTILLQIQAQ